MMKSLNLFFLLLALGFLSSCQSKETIGPVATTNPTSSTTTVGSTMAIADASGQTLLSQGSFMNSVHTVSGTVKVYEKAGKRTLVFTDFQTENGPELHIYLAENTSLRNFIDVSKLTSNGNFSVELPTEADPGKQRFVLIWCKPFSVLFGHAELK